MSYRIPVRRAPVPGRVTSEKITQATPIPKRRKQHPSRAATNIHSPSNGGRRGTLRQSSCRSFPLNEGGFTLIEVLMALFIGAIALTIVNMSFFQVHRSVEAVSSQRQAYQMVRIVMDRMVKDLTCSYAPYIGDPGSVDPQVQMTEDEISMYRFTGLDETKDKTDLDSIH
ncbi:prepilin-type N-terminal cleavage/methylation domain-containing protein, partial [bacterium]|nr:prepilin-type N-terminal cleavage/methylation domain-containing protein [bacterium]